MTLSLTIENETSLPDGGPLQVKVTGKRGLDIGRDTHLDWTLPDPTRHISGKHCEVRYKDGYWLYDISTNGTFLNGSDKRMQSPHRLRTGDRLVIGQYIIAVHVEGDEAAPQPSRVVEPVRYQELWDATSDVAPPVDASLLRAPKERPRPVHADFLDWAADVPDALSESRRGRGQDEAAPAEEDMSWAQGPTTPVPVPEPPPTVPTPRRPTERSRDSGSPVDVSAPRELNEIPARPQEHMPAAREPAPSTDERQAGAPVMDAPARQSNAEELAEFLRKLAQAAGLPPDALSRQNPTLLADEIGLMLRLSVENLRQLLNARRHAKTMTRAVNQTTIEALDNNPLKFSPTTEDALRIMFGPRTRSYLGACQALEQSFGDVKAHQVSTFSAMQHSLQRLLADLDPKVIEADAKADKGLAAVVASRKARLWDSYVARWQAKARGRDGGMVDAFMDCFSESYESAEKRPEMMPGSQAAGTTNRRG